MTTLEKIQDLRKKNIPDSEIISKLKEEGVSPLEITNAMNQSKIKDAVAGEAGTSTEGMVPSIMGGQKEEEQRNSPKKQDTYTPSPSPVHEANNYQDYSSQEPGRGMPEQEMQGEEYSDEYYEEGYPPYEGGQQGYGGDSEAMIEVAEQVFFEKIKKIEEKVNSLREFKALTSPLMEDLDDRLKRIERSFDKMQIAILDKVGSFGKSIDSIKKEVGMVEDSFGKMMKKK